MTGSNFVSVPSLVELILTAEVEVFKKKGINKPSVVCHCFTSDDNKIIRRRGNIKNFDMNKKLYVYYTIQIDPSHFVNNH